MSLHSRKMLLLGLMVLSCLPLFIFLDYRNLQTPDTATKFIASLTGMLGILLMTWQYLLGVRGLVSKLIPDLIWVNNLHKKMGIYGFLMISIHPTFMTLYYLSAGINLLIPTLATRFDQYKTLGEIAYTILAVTWFTSAILRDKISFRWWKRIHIFNLIILPIALTHSLLIGTTLITTNLRYYWYLIALVATGVIVYRFFLFKFLGWGRYRYVVTQVHKLTDSTVQIDMVPEGKGEIVPEPGQFVYYHPLSDRETHPFTVSRYDPVTRTISISPKCSGPFSCMIQNTQASQKVWLDGPYGVFTQEAYVTQRPIVLIAGGIGITPFIRFIEKLQDGLQKVVVLFYGNQTSKDMAYFSLIDSAERANSEFKVINIISHEDNYPGEKGYIDADKLRRHLPQDLQTYEYFICGPEIMRKKIVKDLVAAAVPKAQIHFENFSL